MYFILLRNVGVYVFAAHSESRYKDHREDAEDSMERPAWTGTVAVGTFQR